MNDNSNTWEMLITNRRSSQQSEPQQLRIIPPVLGLEQVGIVSLHTAAEPAVREAVKN